MNVQPSGLRSAAVKTSKQVTLRHIFESLQHLMEFSEKDKISDQVMFFWGVAG